MSSLGMDSPRSTRLLSGGSARTKVELHQVDVQLQKEIDRLERQQSAAVSNIANHQQAMKMSWRKLEQRRTAESPLLSHSKHKSTSPTPSPKRGIFHSNTKLHGGVNAWKTDEAAPPTSISPLVVTVSGDVHHRRLNRGPPPSSSNRTKSSPYLSSPYNMRRTTPGEDGGMFYRTDTHMQPSVGDKSHLDVSPSNQSVTKPLVVTSTDTSSKDKLLKASVLMGVESSSHGPQSFKDFYSSSGVQRSASAASVLVSPIDQSNSSDDLNGENEDEESVKKPDSELTMAEMFEQIKNCRYIRRYHPDGTALEEYH